MKKTITAIVIPVFTIIVGFIIGRYYFIKKNIDQGTITKNEIHINNNETTIPVRESQLKKTSIQQEKVSVNTKIIQITYYKQCGHQIENIISDTKKYVNMTKEEFQKKFPNWGVKIFNTDKIMLYKEEDDFCNEHFLVKNEDGYVTIYTIDNNEVILELLDKTEIAVKYLTKVDQDNLDKGIVIYTKQNLNKLIEDYE